MPRGLRCRGLPVYVHYRFLNAQIAAVEVERRAILHTLQAANIEKVYQLSGTE